ncbi:MAG: sulfurtransferase [Acidocella sp. 20-57-95]|nr:MAG: sulfurtransferase [Acidocella sp. 20-57-95]OYV57877.1 MAG: sulfurtransferase [Acidocella sp. 21-58-7]HQT63833.1 rhodanese-like domain-containing protein [Acidocella sp.]HQU05448.1 rhodanese-like domain-containing protein [Acidocella sp.]
MFFSSKKIDIKNFTPAELHDALAKHAVTLVDVREPGEFAAARIHGAVLFPLSSFDPAALPHDPARPIVLQCGSGKRSHNAALMCIKANVAIAGHLAGGIGAWAGAGLPVTSVDPATGKIIDRA